MSKQITVTREHAEKLVELLGYGLTTGLGKQKPGEMCVEAAVCAAMGLPHGDQPPCVGSVLRSAKITLNDCPHWSSNQARAEGMKAFAVAQLGSTEIDQQAWVNYVVKQTIRRILPIPLRQAAALIPSHKEALEAAALECETKGTRAAAEAAARAARAARADKILCLFAEICVEACIKFKTQGSEWLDLVGR
jgi:hypothetical protein